MGYKKILDLANNIKNSLDRNMSTESCYQEMLDTIEESADELLSLVSDQGSHSWEFIRANYMQQRDKNMRIEAIAGNLHIVLVNLRILNAHIEAELNKRTGVDVTADALESSIKEINELQGTIKKYRREVDEHLDILDKIFHVDVDKP